MFRFFKAAILCGLVLSLTGGMGMAQSNANFLRLTINDQPLNVSWEDNRSVTALTEMAASGSIELNAKRYGGFEQSANLPKSLPNQDTYQTAQPGDIFLYQSRTFVVFYDNNAWSYTKLGHIEGMSQAELRKLLDQPQVTIMIEQH